MTLADPVATVPHHHAAQGTHWLMDCHGCPADVLADLAGLERLLADAARVAGARVLDSHFHRLPPDGVTGVVVLAESHVTIHTWPEHGFAAVDLFLCGETVPERAVAAIEAGLAPERCERRSIVRGR